MRLRRKGSVLHGWWEGRRVRPLWETVCRSLRKLQIEPPQGPAIIDRVFTAKI